MGFSYGMLQIALHISISGSESKIGRISQGYRIGHCTMGAVSLWERIKGFVNTTRLGRHSLLSLGALLFRVVILVMWIFSPLS